ncbi:Protein fmp-52, mitochondrial [Metarhizium anisopliae]|uniref:NAD(P)-binding domain protein n=2 Tax=Metarhizium robertsii TaxID=568076 RepID=E9EQT8_METRA|nr:NAD(P)-binding domain protein [Metarhizium robertsii ARSEF 23]EFZ02594.1 NAD(P)-binding domain protein [Metarhizium robertsii ARSEF 23]EXV05801.1 NAD dependent epimerase/dehydratase family protein [Metarhizium robertsii]KAF5134503.1 Protein fmp-52, mitochondrial [Metarhizium anisopliae]
MSAAVIGSTGLVGSHILSNLLAGDIYKPVHTITRRAPKPSSPNLSSIVDADTTKWAAALTGLSPAPAAVFSALGTTRAQAGGLENQRKIDHDLNIELARAAKEAGVATFVFISSAGSDGLLSGWAPYSKMKKGVEDAVRELGFDHAIILRPGMILGERETSRAAEGFAQAAVRGLGKLSSGFQDALGQDADAIARAAVRAAQLAGENKAPDKFWIIGGHEILKLARAEKEEPKAAESSK